MVSIGAAGRELEYHAPMKRFLPFLVLLSCAGPGPRPEAVLSSGAVATGKAEATEVGLSILRRGGNAVDAGVAVAFALAVTLPEAGNLGGGGFLLCSMPEIGCLDFRETAPAAATRDLFLDARGDVVPGLSLRSHKAAGVPGTVAGLWEAHRKFGSMPWADLVAPAIRLAEEGWTVDPRTAADLEAMRKGAHPSFAKHFPDGPKLVQRDLAACLRRIADRGADGFYKGETARLIAEEMRRGGGLITEADLAAYRPKWRTPVTGTFAGRTIVSMPPPSSGGAILIQLLNMAETGLPRRGSAAYVHRLCEAMKRAYADRAEHLGDPDFVDVPVALLTSKAYAAKRMAEAPEAGRRTDPANVRAGERDHTTHFSVIDRNGHACSVTTTINDSYGSGIVVDGAGFLLNNEMDDFSSKPGVPNMYGVVGGDANAIAPGKRMLSSMTPTLVFDAQGRIELVLGSPGGPRIITTVLQVLLNRLHHGMSLAEAVAAPRFHHQWPSLVKEGDAVLVEPGFLPQARSGLTLLGYTLVDRRGMGLVNAVEIDGKSGRCLAVSDPRGIGTAGTE